jgi:hypothetical protein
VWKFLCGGQDEMEAPSGESGSSIKNGMDLWQDSLSKSVPNLSQMWGKLVMMGTRRSSLFAVTVESTDMSTTKIRELGVQGLGVLMLDRWFELSVMVEAPVSFIEELAILLSTCFLIISLLALLRQL